MTLEPGLLATWPSWQAMPRGPVGGNSSATARRVSH
jgi:hypothetical protein